MEEIMEAIGQYGLETVLIALLINILTGLIKIPLKKWAGRLEDSSKATRFIVFLPIVFGFVLSALYMQFFGDGFAFDEPFVSLWVASGSLSLTFYAIFEKMFPKKQKTLSEEELAANQAVLDGIQEAVEQTTNKQEGVELSAETEPEHTEESAAQAPIKTKIILRGKKADENQAETAEK